MNETSMQARHDIVIERERCEGYGFCVDAAPDLLFLDDEGELHTRTDGFGEDQRVAAEAALRVCPVAALKLNQRFEA